MHLRGIIKEQGSSNKYTYMSKSCPPIAGDDMVSGGSRNLERGFSHWHMKCT